MCYNILKHLPITFSLLTAKDNKVARKVELTVYREAKKPSETWG